jgi:hypothetical protein
MEARLKKTIFGFAANQLDALRRAAQRQYDLRYHEAPTKSEGEILSEEEKIQSPANQIIKQLPKATLIDTMVVDDLSSQHNPLVRTSNVTVPCDLYSCFNVKLGSSDKSYVLQMGNLKGQGVYNHVYDCTWTAEHLNNRQTDAVFKTPVLPAYPLDLLMESVVHALLMQVQGREYFVHMIAAVRVPSESWPAYRYGVVQARHPGIDLDQLLDQYKVDDVEHIAILQQVAYALLQAQAQLKFMHRDCKADNILVCHERDNLFEGMLESEMQLLRRPKTIKVSDQVSFDTCGYSIQLCDFGASFVHPDGDGKPFAVPIIQDSAEFNPCTDLAHLMATLLTDFKEDIRKYAPHVFEFLSGYCAGLLHKRQQQEDRSIYDICQEETDERFMPLHFIKALQAFRKQLDAQQPDLVAKSRVFRTD